jgi:hypothetical protein
MPCYRCVHCGAETPSLYKFYSPTSIKLTSCSKCLVDVDPYVEREWILIVLDCLLLRTPAYRHVLWNSGLTQKSSWRLLQMLIALVIMEVYLQCYCNIEVIDTCNDTSTVTRNASTLLMYYSVGFLIQGAVIYSGIQQSSAVKTISFSEISLALLLPSCWLSFLAVLVTVWETSVTVRLCSKVLEMMLQVTAVSSIGVHQTLLLVSLTARMLLGILLWRYSPDAIPCWGISWNDYCLAV